MYKVLLIHEVVPGQLSALKRWFQDADRERKAQNPDYSPPRRYITVIGSLTRVYCEWEWEKVPDHPLVWTEAVEGQGDFKDLIVPGMTKGYVLKELAVES